MSSSLARHARPRRFALSAAAFLSLFVSRAVPAQDSADTASNAAPAYDFGKYAEQYFTAALTPETLSSSFAETASAAVVHTILHDFTPGNFQSRLAEDLARKSFAGSIDFVTASLLHQNIRFVSSGEHGVRSRIRFAFLQSFIARGPQGNDEFAASRLAAAFGTAAVLDGWHPWLKKEPNFWNHAGFIFGGYIVRSFWTEFKPDLKHEFHALWKHGNTIIEP